MTSDLSDSQNINKKILKKELPKMFQVTTIIFWLTSVTPFKYVNEIEENIDENVWKQHFS